MKKEALLRVVRGRAKGERDEVVEAWEVLGGGEEFAEILEGRVWEGGD